MPFAEYCRRKEQAAARATLPPYRTVSDATASVSLVPIGSDFSRQLFDGAFYRSAHADTGMPLVSLVFVQSADGNTGAADPSTLGGGEIDKHLIYEGLSRVDADAVMSGATTARAPELVFSVWHPEMVALRLARGQVRHPAQVIVTNSGDLAWDGSLMLATPQLRAFVVTGTHIAKALAQRVRDRPWVSIVDAGEPLSMRTGLRELASAGLAVISCIGGRRTADALLREGLISDVYLTTSPRRGGEPNTPLYGGAPLPLTRVIEKAATGPEQGVRFEHFSRIG